MRQNEKQGLSDITTSEGYLRRFSIICRLIQLEKVSGPDIIPLIRSRTTGLTRTGGTLTNPKVIRRHLSIMSRIGILNPPTEGYRVSSDGKALIHLMGNDHLTMRDVELGKEETIFYFIKMFGNAFWQLYLLLQSLLDSENKSKTQLIADYFTILLDKRLRIWSHQQIHDGLLKFSKHNELPPMFKNRYECMSMWLNQLGLIDNNNILTGIGRTFTINISRLLEQNQNVLGSLYNAASIYVTGIVDSLSRFTRQNNSHLKAFDTLFHDSYLAFRNLNLRMSDAKSMRTYMCIKMLVDYNTLFEESDFDNAILNLSNQGVIRSAMTGRDGKLAYVKLG